MKIESIRLKNFKCFKDTELSNLPHFCMLVGANDTEKSSIFQILEFLHYAMSSNINAVPRDLKKEEHFKRKFALNVQITDLEKQVLKSKKISKF